MNAKLSRFSATPAEIDRHLRTILAEDTYLNYQRVIGNLAVEEAAKNLRMMYAANEAPVQWVEAADDIDPMKGGGQYPSQLLCSRHNGFGACPGAPRCTPRSEDATQPLERKSAPDPYADVIVLNFSMRVLNCLRRGGIHDVRTLLARSEEDLMDIKGFGSGALYEVKDALAAHGLELAS